VLFFIQGKINDDSTSKEKFYSIENKILCRFVPVFLTTYHRISSMFKKQENKMPNFLSKLNVSRTLIIIVALFAFSAFASNAQGVRGVVTDPAGLPVIGASVFEKGTSNGTVTDENGL